MTSPTRPTTSAADLRARNLARNRAEVADIALALFAERGFDEVTVDDIAEVAGISRRTFFRYFDSKEDAVLPYEDERLEQLREALASRPADEPLLLGIRHASLHIAASTDLLGRTETLVRLRIAEQHPSVHARGLELQSRWEAAIRELIAEHLGVDADTSVVAHVVASATTAAFRAAAEVWLATGGERRLVEVLEEAYDVLTRGLPLVEE